MREVLYVSEQKLEFMFLDAGSRTRPRVTESSVGVPGVVNAKLTLGSSGPREPSDSARIAVKLDRVVEFLDRVHRPADFTFPAIHAYQWMRFDLDMAFGTVYEDTAWPPRDGDIALFAGGARPSAGDDRRPVELLLCGSVHHLRHRVATSSRMGSDTHWLYDVIKEMENRNEQGVHVLPEFLTDLLPLKKRKYSMAEAARNAYQGFLNSTFPAHARGRLRGHARVLLHDDNVRLATRLVLATPLYVEIPPPAAAGKRFLRALRR